MLENHILEKAELNAKHATSFHDREKENIIVDASKKISEASFQGKFFTKFSDEQLSFTDSSVIWFYKHLRRKNFSVEVHIEHNLDEYAEEGQLDEEDLEEYELLFHDVSVNFELLLSVSMLETLAEAEEHGIIKNVSFDISWF